MGVEEIVNELTSYLEASELKPHLQKVLLSIIQNRPRDPSANLERISALLKSEEALREISPEQIAACKALLKTIKVKVPKPEGEEGGEEPEDPVEGGEEEAEGDNVGEVEDVLAQARMFEWAGVGLGHAQMYRVFLAIKALVKKEPLASARFWGKIMGRDQDYYVAEVVYNDGARETGIPEPEPEPEPEEDPEGTVNEDKEIKPVVVPPEEAGDPADPIFKSPNTFVYFVCHRLGEPWIRLPDIKPAQIVAARANRCLLTGHLTAKVYGFPSFPGLEAEYLRAQIARISHGCTLCPYDYLSLDPEDEAAEPAKNEEFNGVAARDLLSNEDKTGWTRRSQDILHQGRCVFWSPDGDADEEEEEEEDGKPKKIRYVERNQPPMKNIHTDEPVGVHGCPAWTTRMCSTLSPQYAIATARSNRWPGAFAVAFGKVFCNIYIGWGQKAETAEFAYAIPPVVGEIGSDAQPPPTEVDDLFLKPAPPPAEGEGEGEE